MLHTSDEAGRCLGGLGVKGVVVLDMVVLSGKVWLARVCGSSLVSCPTLRPIDQRSSTNVVKEMLKAFKLFPQGAFYDALPARCRRSCAEVMISLIHRCCWAEEHQLLSEVDSHAKYTSRVAGKRIQTTCAAHQDFSVYLGPVPPSESVRALLRWSTATLFFGVELVNRDVDIQTISFNQVRSEADAIAANSRGQRGGMWLVTSPTRFSHALRVPPHVRKKASS